MMKDPRLKVVRWGCLTEDDWCDCIGLCDFLIMVGIDDPRSEFEGELSKADWVFPYRYDMSYEEWREVERVNA